MKKLSEISDAENNKIQKVHGNLKIFVDHFDNINEFGWSMIKSNFDSKQGFVAAYTQSQIYFSLAALANIREHQVEFNLNYRYAIESAALACYTLEHDNLTELFELEKDKTFNTAYFQKVQSKKVYKWFNEKYPTESSMLKEHKDIINSFGAHANIGFTASNFDFDKNESFFFDKTPEHLMITNLWSLSNTLLIMYNMYGRINNANGEKVKFRKASNEKYNMLAKENNKLKVLAKSKFGQSVI